MKIQSLSQKILDRMQEKEKGSIFSNHEFNDLGNTDAVRKSLSRLCIENKIYPLIEGYYTIPYFIEVVQEYSYPTADELARKIAEKYTWTITAHGDNALNQVGLSTQIPVVCEYLSDGPYREYEYLSTKIKLKHTSNRMVSNYSKYTSLLIQSIKALGRNNISKKYIEIMAIFKKIHQRKFVARSKDGSVWIYEVIKRICEVA